MFIDPRGRIRFFAPAERNAWFDVLHCAPLERQTVVAREVYKRLAPLEPEPRTRLRNYSASGSVNKFVLDCVVSEFGIRLHAHLLQYPRPVSTDGAIAQREQGGNLANRFS